MTVGDSCHVVFSHCILQDTITSFGHHQHCHYLILVYTRRTSFQDIQPSQQAIIKLKLLYLCGIVVPPDFLLLLHMSLDSKFSHLKKLQFIVMSKSRHFSELAFVLLHYCGLTMVYNPGLQAENTI